MTLVSIFVVSVDFKLPVSCAFLRMRCTASITPLCWARNALPNPGPLDVVGQALTNQAVPPWPGYARIPSLLRDCIRKRFVLQPRVFRQPLLKLDRSMDYVDAARVCAATGLDKGQSAPRENPADRRNRGA